MLYLLWLMLNIVLTIYFLIVCINAGKFVREKMGNVALLVFAIGVMSFMTAGRKKDEMPSKGDILWKSGMVEQFQENILKGRKMVRIYKNLVFSIWLNVDYKMEGEVKKPFRAFCSNSGITGPSDWETLNISLYEIDKDKGKYSYSVNGSITNRLLLINFLETSDVYHGSFLLD